MCQNLHTSLALGYIYFTHESEPSLVKVLQNFSALSRPLAYSSEPPDNTRDGLTNRWTNLFVRQMAIQFGAVDEIRTRDDNHIGSVAPSTTRRLLHKALL